MQTCEYFLVHYAPSLSSDLRVPIGILLLDGSGRLVRCALTDDWRTVRCMDPACDSTVLEALPAHFRQLVEECSAPRTGNRTLLRERLLALAENGFGAIQLSAPRGLETEDPAREFEYLFRQYIERRPRAAAVAPPRAGSRRWIQDRLRVSLERHSLWDRLSRNIPVEEFTAPGDGFRMDFAWQPNGVRNYLHALSLDHDWNQAKVLSYTFWRIRQHAPARLTAVVADSGAAAEAPGAANPAARSCRQLLLDSGIALQPLGGLDGFLEQVRREMHFS